jgi:chromosome segregation ATPase
LLISEVVKKSFTTGFNIERYGLLNSGGETIEKEVIKEVIKYVEVPVVEEKEVVRIEYVEVEKPIEVIKEVQVEKIVEVIKEIPVDKVVIKEVIKEVPVETVVTKIEYISDNTQTNELLSKIQELESQMSKKDKNLDELRQTLDIALDKPPVEIEKIVEVIKEVVVEKESTDNNWKPKLEALQNTVQKLKQDNIDKDKKIREYEKTIEDIQKFNDDKKALFLKGSNLDDKLYR